MKKNYILILSSLFILATSNAQLTEDFETDLSAWTQQGATNDNGDEWAITTSRAQSGVQSVFFDDFSGDHDRYLLASPQDLSSMTAPLLTFSENINWSGYGVTHQALYSTDYSGDVTTATWNVLYDAIGAEDAWVEHVFSLPASANVTIAFHYVGNYAAEWFIDDVSIPEAPSCNSPTGITASSITQGGADISWTAGGTESAWNIEYGPTGFTQGQGTVEALTANSYSFSGLTANTAHDVYVQADCGGDISGWTSVFTFNTLCDPISSFPYLEDFTPGNSSLNCWGVINNGDPNTWNFTTNGEAAISYGSTAHDDYLVTPNWNVQAGVSDRITLEAKNQSLNYPEEFDVLLSTTGSSPADFTETIAAGVVPPAAFQSYTYDLAAYIGQDVYIAFHNTTTDLYILFVDNFEIKGIPACLEPSGLSASNVTTNAADLSWTAGGTETAWNIEYDSSGFTLGTGNNMGVTTNPYTLGNLNPSTSYDYYVQADCGSDQSPWSGPFTFSTECLATTAPSSQDFDAGLSICWSQETVSDQLDWFLGNGLTPSNGGGHVTGPSDDVSGGGNYVFLEASGSDSADIAIIYSEEIDISALAYPELRFFSHMYSTQQAMGTMTVDLWDGTSYTNLFTKSGDQGNLWNEELILLSTSATTVSFRITGETTANSGGFTWCGDMAIDNFGIQEAQANDLAIIAAVAQSGCDLTSAEPIEVWVENQGLSVESNFDVSYSVNGGTPVVETFTGQLPPGDTLMHVFAATADMSADGIYNVDLHVDLATDNDTTDNHYLTSGENYLTPAAATTMGDTICDGDTAYVSAMSDGYVVWYDAMTGGNVLGEDEDLMVAPNTTTSYYAEVMAVDGFYEDFESYTAGDLIAASSNVWEAWTGPNGGGADDAEVSSAQANDGSNSLLLDNANGDDVVLPFGEAYNSGLFIYSMDMYIETSAYFNLQASTSIGAAWAFDVILNGNVFDIQIGGASVLTGSYSGTDPMNNPKWFNITFEANITDSIWEVFTSGISRGTFTYVGPVAAANLYANTGNKYYVDNVEWAALKDDACISGSRTEAIVEVNNCTGINSISNSDFAIFPNPNKGEFTVSNSSDIVNVIITDVQGKVVYSMNNINLNKINVNISDLEKGMYMINVETKNTTITESVIVQ
jgi:hypothetical protein